MKLSELFGRAEVEYPPSLGDLEICNIVSDSRRVTKGSLFVCVRGLQTDGHDKIGEAIKNGAVVIVAELVRDVFVGGAAIVTVENTRTTLALLHHAWYGCPADRMKIIGVTGTNGKTSVVWILNEIFRTLGYRCGMIGTLGFWSCGKKLSLHSGGALANMTTPDPAELYLALSQMEREGVEFVFMEVTSHALAQGRCDAIGFDMAVFTNLSRDHLDFHHDMDTYFGEKKKLFDQADRSLICVDGSYGKKLYDLCYGRASSCSLTGNADYSAENLISRDIGVSSFLMRTPTGSYPVFLPLGGQFAIINSLQAAAVACEYGIAGDRVSFALSKIKSVPGRMERVDVGYPSDIQVWIDYAHTPDALENLLLSFQKQEPFTRRILVFGCGGERDRSKRKEMAHIACRFADYVIVTSDNSRGEDPKQIFADILKGIDKEKPYEVIPDRAQAIEKAISLCRTGDAVILAGKGHEQYEMTKEGRRPFDERKIAARAVKKYFPPQPVEDEIG